MIADICKKTHDSTIKVCGCRVCVDICEGAVEGDLRIQYEATAQKHVGTEARVQTLQEPIIKQLIDVIIRISQ